MESLRRETPDTGRAERPKPSLHAVREPSVYESWIKPLLDRTLGAVLLVFAAPLLLFCMIAVRLFVGRPTIFRQQRVGLGGNTFELLKLRTMIPDRRSSSDYEYGGTERRQTHKSPSDPRVVPVGAALRAMRLDELPQLWNVIRGDMSLVGPRPELTHIVNEYQDWQHERHLVKPGLTGLWQVSAPEGKLMHECTELDLEYIDTVSLKTDLGILARTPVAMFKRHGF